jgi:hypothetical protein
MFVAGGTDLYPKLKRRQFEIDTLIGLDFLTHGIRNVPPNAPSTPASRCRRPHTIRT